MRLFGYDVTIRKQVPRTLNSVDARGGWWPVVREPFSGAWQRNIELRQDQILAYAPVFTCVDLISSDVGKLRLRLVEQEQFGVWTEVESSAFSPVLRKPNRYQNRIQFFKNWVISKLIWGNTYVLKGRDQRGVVNALYILDANRTRPLVSEDGQIFYQLYRDNLSGLVEDNVVVPASEIIHDVMIALYHPLCGVSPIYAAGAPATQGVKIQEHSTTLFSNNASPGGVLSAPGFINNDTADRIKKMWEDNYSGSNAGKIAVLGDGLAFTPMTINPVDAELLGQLRWTAEQICSVFHVPPHMAGYGAAPAYNNIEALNQQYYAQCLQMHIESIELCLDEGLGLDRRLDSGKLLGTEFDLDDLLRMDTSTKVRAAGEAIKSGLSPDEVRRRFYGLGPTKGGASPMMQQQYFSLAALAERDATNPLALPAPVAPAPSDEPAPDEGDDEDGERAASFAEDILTRRLQFRDAA